MSDSATPWTAAHQAPLSVGFPRQEYCSGVPLPSPEDLPCPGIKPKSSTLQADSLVSEPPGKLSISKASTSNAGDCLRCRRSGFNPWVRKIPCRRAWQPTPVFLSGESHGQRSLAGCGPQGYEEVDMTEVTEHAHTLVKPPP